MARRQKAAQEQGPEAKALKARDAPVSMQDRARAEAPARIPEQQQA